MITIMTMILIIILVLYQGQKEEYGICVQIPIFFNYLFFFADFLTYSFPMYPFSAPLKTSENRKVF